MIEYDEKDKTFRLVNAPAKLDEVGSYSMKIEL